MYFKKSIMLIYRLFAVVPVRAEQKNDSLYKKINTKNLLKKKEKKKQRF